MSRERFCKISRKNCEDRFWTLAPPVHPAPCFALVRGPWTGGGGGLSFVNQKTFSRTVGIVFLAIAILHLVRILIGWDAVIAGWLVPLWISWVVVLISGYLVYQGLKFSNTPQ